jgi:hypothetical protein
MDATVNETAGSNNANFDVTVTCIPMAHISVGDRKRQPDRATIDQLKADILRQGMLQPIGVRSGSGELNGAFQLIYGLGRLTAKRELEVERKLRDSTILASVYPAHVADWQCELAEIGENLHRKELSPAERGAHTTLCVAIVKRHFDIAEANSRDGVVTRSDAAGVSSRNGLGIKPTAREKVASDLGTDKKTVDKRVSRAAKSVGRVASVEKTPAATLTEIANEALRRASAPSKTAADVKVTKWLAKFEQQSGVEVGDIQGGIEAWWQAKHPTGEVIFNEEPD